MLNSVVFLQLSPCVPDEGLHKISEGVVMKVKVRSSFFFLICKIKMKLALYFGLFCVLNICLAQYLEYSRCLINICYLSK